ncbi:tetratricopeptide repeat protein [Carbonactinospora thermoautotrophica]|uniref:hypothetical protein n=1 Tax=Carbonactinospora thermoautotrophica TaxID=1469144 RepID=UPI00099EA771
MIPADATLDQLDPDVRRELSSLPKSLAEQVGGHLLMAGRLFDEDPERAYEHARAAQRLASRIAVTREASGLAAYATGRFAEALAELRTAYRISGSHELWPIMADCERGLGRPERALEMARAPEVRALDKASRAEMRIVAAGARRDLGQLDAAVVTLQCPELHTPGTQPWVARLRYAYADALLAANREDEARYWFSRAVEADPRGETDAADRLAELEGLQFLDLLAEAEEEGAEPAPEAPAEAEGEPPAAGSAEEQPGAESVTEVPVDVARDESSQPAGSAGDRPPAEHAEATATTAEPPTGARATAENAGPSASAGRDPATSSGQRGDAFATPQGEDGDTENRV